jgi:hypothetical protein
MYSQSMSLVEEIAQKLDKNDRDYVVSKLETSDYTYADLLAKQFRASSADDKEEQVEEYVGNVHGDENKLADLKRRIMEVEKRQENISPWSLKSQRDQIGNPFAAPSNKMDFQSRHHAREPLSLKDHLEYMQNMQEAVNAEREFINQDVDMNAMPQLTFDDLNALDEGGRGGSDMMISRETEDAMEKWTSNDPKSDGEEAEEAPMTLEESAWNTIHGENPFRQSFEFDRTTDDFPGTDKITSKLRSLKEGRIVDTKGLLQMEGVIKTSQDEIRMPKE